MACRPQALEGAERRRQRELLDAVRVRRLETRELPDGYALRLPDGAASFRDAAEWIGLERRCCPFLAFALEWRRDDSVWVELTGAPGAKAVIAAELAAAPR